MPARWPAAGGLEDPDTGLVRFGWRDYDPTVGRFTAPDPLGDTGGDHDLYDYCVDDPVSCVDPEGLIPVPLLFLAGKALALGLGLGGAYAAAAATDVIGNHYGPGSDIRIPPSKRKNISAVDAVTTVAPMVTDIHQVAQLPGSLALNIATGTLPAFLRNQTLMQFATKGIGDSHQLEE